MINQGKGENKKRVLDKQKEFQKESQIYSIPKNLNNNIHQLNLPNNNISNLTGISKYQSLVKINLRQNCISELVQIDKLKVLRNLKTLILQNNQIAKKINYRYLVYLKLPKLTNIDGLNLKNCSVQQVKSWQHSIGLKLIQFQYQKCQIISRCHQNQISDQLKYIVKCIEPLERQLNQNGPGQQILLINKLFQDLLPLNGLGHCPSNQETQRYIIEYLMQLIIKIGSKQQPQFVDNLLIKISPSDQKEEQRLVSDPMACLKILSDQVNKEYKISCLAQAEAENNTKELSAVNIKHLLSAETALDSHEREQQQGQHFSTQFPHFALDESFVKIILNMITIQSKKTIEFLNTKSKDEAVENVTFSNNMKSFDKAYEDIQGRANETLSTKKFLSPIGTMRSEQVYQQYSQQQDEQTGHQVHPYYNPYILENLLKTFQKILLTIYFKKIRIIAKKQQMLGIFSVLEQKYTPKLLQYSMLCIKNQSVQAQYLQEKIRKIKLKIIFNSWRNIKKRRDKLLKKIMKSKIQDDCFNLTIYFQKWKLNARSDRIKRMASSALLQTCYKNKTPQSKQGIDQIYKRIVTKYRLK